LARFRASAASSDLPCARAWRGRRPSSRRTVCGAGAPCLVELVGEGDDGKARVFPDRLPIGIHLAGRGVVVYVVTDPWLDELRLFLERHAALLRAFPAWTLRIVVPPHWPDVARRSKQVVWNQLLTPLPEETADELRWYFEPLRTHPTPSRGDDVDERFHEARAAFSGPRFKALCRAWKQDSEAVLVSAPGMRFRREVPKSLAIHFADLTAGDVERVEGVPVTTPARSIRDAHAAHLGNELVGQAIADGRRSGVLSMAEANRLERELLGTRPKRRRSTPARRRRP
jgi:hypothetical protein